MTRAFLRIRATVLLILVTTHVAAAVRYVDLNSANPTPPFTSWAMAATVIQEAVDAAEPGDEVLVTNGIYATGGRAVFGTMTNRVAVTKPLTLRSINGPEATVVQGRQVPITGWGAEAIRCVYLADGAVLSGFTLTNGATSATDYGGGGVCSESTNALVTNCTITANRASGVGGGAYLGTLNNCTIAGNWAPRGGGAGGSVMNYCALTNNSAAQGGGAADGTLSHCTLTGNSADGGGATHGGMLNHCMLTGNSTRDCCGAAWESTLDDCILTGNHGLGAYQATLNLCTVTRNGGGVQRSLLNNCIVYHNEADGWPGDVQNHWASSLNYCCTTPLPTSGVGNLTNEPAFVNLASGDLRLLPTSPCINAGNNAYVSDTTDLDGNPRIVGGTVDIGAYEFQTPTSLLSYTWAQQYGLPTDGSADFTDPDADRLNNWQEWNAGTIPTNALSALRLFTPVSDGTNLTVTWESVAGRSYLLERSPDLSAAPAFTPVATGIPGQANTTSFVDTNAVGASLRCYRVGVE